jgi:alkylation response protein AidB-like acyl-CoA dehydrogenase
LSALAEGRISIAAACVGIARSALEQAARYLGERKAFGGPLAEQQGLRFMRRRAGTRRRGGTGVDAGRRGARRIAASRSAWPSSLAKVDRVGHGDARRDRRGPAVRRQRLLAGDRRGALMRDAKGAQIYEGTNQIHRLIVADEVFGGR